jgi:predicted amidophosphoribosyltransferase
MIYTCKYCGKLTDYGRDLCQECKRRLEATYGKPECLKSKPETITEPATAKE